MVQAEGGGYLACAAVHKDNQEAGEYHGQRIELGHPGHQNARKALSARQCGGDGVIDATHQQKARQAAYGAG